MDAEDDTGSDRNRYGRQPPLRSLHRRTRMVAERDGAGNQKWRPASANGRSGGQGAHHRVGTQGHQAARQEAENQNEGTVHGEHHAHVERCGHAGGRQRRVEVHHLHDAQVVERADQRHRDGEHGQRDVRGLAGSHQGLQHRQLGVETHHRRDARQREQADGHHAGIQRAALVQARQVGDLFALEAFARQQQDDAEARQRGQHVGQDVEHRRAVGVLDRVRIHVAVDDARQQAQQHEAHLRDGRVRQHALQVGLRDGCQVAHEQRADRQHGQHLLPIDGQRQQTVHQQADHDGERRELGRAADDDRHGRRRAVVDVRNPHVERHGADLEREAGHDEHEAEHQHLVADLARVHGLEDLADVERAGGAVQHREAVEQEAARHRAEHEVLHGGFGGRDVVAAQCHQRIAGEREQLQAQVDHEEVVARHHDEHAQQHEHREREQLAAAQHASVRGVGPAIDQRHHHGDGREALEPVAHGVADHHVAEAVERVAAARVHALQHGHDGQGEHGEHVGAGATGARHAQVHQGDHAGHHQEHDLRVHRQPADVVNHLGLSLSVGSMELGLRHVLQQLGHRHVHHVGEGARIEAHVEHGHSQHAQHQEFAGADVQQAAHVVVAHRAEIDALEHPQRVCGAEDQRGGGQQTDPEVRLHGAQDHHPLAHEAGGARKAAVGHREQQREGRELGHGVDHAAVGRDLPRMHAVVQHADREEHRARHEAVGDHLHQAAGDAQVVEDEEAQRHEAHVRHGRIRHQLLHVLLHHGHQAHVDHRHQRQRDHQPRPVACGIRSDGHREAQETVGPQLQHDGRQHGGAARGGFHVHVRQPGVHRPHRHLHGEGREEGEEQQRLRAGRQRQLVPRGDVEAAAGLVVQVHQRDQHQQRAEQRVEEELEGRVDLVRATPDADDEVHRDQRGFEEHVEQQAVHGAEHADHEAREDQERAHVLVHALGDRLPGRDHHDHRDEGRQRHEPERDAVQAQVVVHVEALDPEDLLDELRRGGAVVEVAVERQRHGQADQRADQRDPADGARLIVAPEGQQQGTEGDRRPDGKTQQTHFSCSSTC